jgi:hypothetical protein
VTARVKVQIGDEASMKRGYLLKEFEKTSDSGSAQAKNVGAALTTCRRHPARWTDGPGPPPGAVLPPSVLVSSPSLSSNSC